MYDVCLLLEGTYPFVSGGVSTWVHNLICAFPEIQFTGVCILPTSEGKWEKKYTLPQNIRDLEIVYLHDYELDQTGKTKKRRQIQHIQMLRQFHNRMFGGDFAAFKTMLPFFRSSQEEWLSSYDMIFGKRAWELLLEFYNPEENSESFIDYFWSYRFTHLPIFKILNAEIPKANVYHTVSTGYAGLLGVIAKHLYKRPLLLTEHGIYTKERKIEISQAEWIYVASGDRIKVQKDLSSFQKLWVRLFEALGKITYNEAAGIITLYEGNRQQQIAGGADPKKTFVIPNGIDIEKFGRLKPDEFKNEKKATFTIGFMGRVVPIKDVKTLIRAYKIVSLHLPNVKFYIMGPTDEDPDYYRECIELIQILRLQGPIEFTGKVDVMDYYPRLDLIVLTSISEAQPLVILEANCAGIPVVASDVGSCRELLEGRTEADKALGPSGIVTRVADPADTANAIVTILSNDELKRAMSLSGPKRIKAFYQERNLNRKYLKIYKKLLSYQPRETS